MAQVLCLRLAIILHHARIDQPAHVAQIIKARTRCRVNLDANWAQQQPRTLHQLQEEVRRWNAAGPHALELTWRKPS